MSKIKEEEGERGKGWRRDDRFELKNIVDGVGAHPGDKENSFICQ